MKYECILVVISWETSVRKFETLGYNVPANRISWFIEPTTTPSTFCVIRSDSDKNLFARTTKYVLLKGVCCLLLHLLLDFCICILPFFFGGQIFPTRTRTFCSLNRLQTKWYSLAKELFVQGWNNIEIFYEISLFKSK